MTLIHVTLCPPLFSLIRTSYAITDSSFFLIKEHHLVGRFSSSEWDWENNQFTLETMSQPCKENNSNWVWI